MGPFLLKGFSVSDENVEEGIVRAFYAAKCVHHYYHMHTEGDGPNDRVRIENLQKVIELMTGKPIFKRAVPINGSIIRGLTERYDDRFEITIRSTQSIAWQKFTTVKEFSHIVADSESAFEADPNVSISQLVARNGILISKEMSPALLSEGIAEVTALELIYPLELRAIDAEKLKSGKSVLDIEEERHVPPHFIQMATRPDYIESCKQIWKNLPVVTPGMLTDN